MTQFSAFDPWKKTRAIETFMSFSHWILSLLCSVAISFLATVVCVTCRASTQTTTTTTPVVAKQNVGLLGGQMPLMPSHHVSRSNDGGVDGGSSVKCQLKTKKGLIDMSALSKTSYSFSDSKNYFHFFVSVCSNHPTLCEKQPYPSSYHLQLAPGQCVASLGRLSQTKILGIEGDSDGSQGAVIEYWGGQKTTGTGSDIRTRIVMNCDKSLKDVPVSKLEMKLVKDEEVDGVIWFHFQMSSAQACPGFGGASSKRGVLGVGGIILIVLFSLAVLYLIVGSAVMKFKFQKEGLDILIHREYFVLVALLIWDGILFVFKDGLLSLVYRVTGKNQTSYEQV